MWVAVGAASSFAFTLGQGEFGADILVKTLGG